MTELDHLKGIGVKSKSLLNKLKINSIEDLINFYPFRYDVIKRSDIYALEQDDKIIIDGIIETVPSVFYIKKALNKMSFKLSCEMLLNITIFNRAFLKRNLTVGKKITVIGKYDKKHHSIVASDILFKPLDEKVEIKPVYHMVYGISNKQLSHFVDLGLKQDISIKDYIPEEFVKEYHFTDKKDMILELHYPTSIQNLKKARLRGKYEELFIFMLQMNYLKSKKKNEEGLPKIIDRKKVDELLKTLPFTLTEDQIKSIDDIYHDLISKNRMNRLLQGDVGSGKTIVSVFAMYMNFLAGYQSALMAPTEILANQHFNNITKILPENIHIALLTGKTKAKEKKVIYEKLENGDIDIIIGTHALISEKVVYKNLGLVITDEQHRFGVNQRSNLKNKGITPDILYMSATPIPRTYALTLYGDMDISNIKTKPVGRGTVKTVIKSEKNIREVLEKMLEVLKEKHQIYVIAPLIEESDKIDLENVNDLYDKMNKAFGKYYNIGLLHGKMSPKEKDEVMDKFKNNEYQILISTTVIEVGVDVFNATMMVIFDAFRFGLSALHQLRGRVGRNSYENYCYLVSNYEAERLKILESTTDGFKVSEEDFRLRGSGDLFGVKQSGEMSFHLADIKKDFSLLVKVKEDSEKYLKENFDSKICKEILGKLENID